MLKNASESYSKSMGKNNSSLIKPLAGVLLAAGGGVAIGAITFLSLSPPARKVSAPSEPAKGANQGISYVCPVKIATSGGVISGDEKFTYMKKGDLVLIDQMQEGTMRTVPLVANATNGILVFQTPEPDPVYYRLDLNTLALETKVTISNPTDGRLLVPGNGTCKVAPMSPAEPSAAQPDSTAIEMGQSDASNPDSAEASSQDADAKWVESNEGLAYAKCSIELKDTLRSLLKNPAISAKMGQLPSPDARSA